MTAWRLLEYSSPGLFLPFQLCRRIRSRVYRITPPIYRAITLDEISLYEKWRPC